MGGCFEKSVVEIGNTPRRGQLTEEEKRQIKKLDPAKYSKALFAALNSVRGDKNKYGQLLERVLSLSSEEEAATLKISGVTLQEDDLVLITHLFKYISTNDDKISIIKEISVNLLKESNAKEIKWSDEAYKISTKNYDNLDSNRSQEVKNQINKAMNKNIYIKKYSIENYYEPICALWHILLDNKEQIKSLLTDDYLYGFSKTTVTKNYSFTTSIILLNENTNAVVIDGTNPVTGEKEPLLLTDKIFDKITYKSQIVGGSYVYSGDSVLNVVFKLLCGESKEENLIV